MLGLIEAGLGNKEEAIRLGCRTMELLPLEKDSIRGPYMIAHLAMIAAWVGEKDLALEQMRLFEKLTPAGFHYGKLKLDPRGPAPRRPALRSHRRFTRAGGAK